MEALTAALVDLVVVLAGGALTVLIAYILKRTKLTGNVIVEQMARTAIAYAEEFAAKQVKAGLDKWTGDEKLAAAVKVLLAKVPGITAEEAEVIVQAELAKVNLGAAATIKAIADAAKTPEPVPVPPTV